MTAATTRTVSTLPGGVIAVPAEVAAQLIALPGFLDLKTRSRGTRMAPTFDALWRCGLANQVPSRGTFDPFRRAGVSPWLTTEQAADLLGISDRAVRKQLALGQLQGERKGQRWRIARRDVEAQIRRRGT